MITIIQLIEKLGRGESLTTTELDSLEPSLREALLEGDISQLERLLKVQQDIVCLIMQPDEEEDDEEDDQSEDEKDDVRRAVAKLG